MRQLLFTLLLLCPLLSDAQKTLTYPDGSTYVGETKGGKRHGKGVYLYKNGEKYDGHFNRGKRHGQGTYTFLDGSKYVGEYKNGKRYSEGKTIPAPEVVNSLDASTKSTIRVRISESEIGITKIAVIGKESKLCDETTDDGQSLAELVEGELIGLYGVVERKHLEDILDEQRLAMGGLVLEDTDFAQAGCLAGAQGTVLASYGCLQGKTKIQVKLVDCSTSDMYWSATGFEVTEFELLDELRVKLENR